MYTWYACRVDGITGDSEVTDLNRRDGASMQRTREIYVGCRITLSAFSGERIFRVFKTEGGEYIGAAPVHYFYSSDGESLEERILPLENKTVQGFIQALLIENGGNEASVVFPGGEMVTVNVDQVRRSLPEAVSHVPV